MSFSISLERENAVSQALEYAARIVRETEPQFRFLPSLYFSLRIWPKCPLASKDWFVMVLMLIQYIVGRNNYEFDIKRDKLTELQTDLPRHASSRVAAATNYSFKHLKPTWYLWSCHSGQGRPVLPPGNLLPTSYHPRHRTGGPQNFREVERNKNVITLNFDYKICPFFLYGNDSFLSTPSLRYLRGDGSFPQ